MSDITETIMVAALVGDLDVESAGRLMDLSMIVQRQITCPITGRVLDIRTAHLWDVTADDGVVIGIGVFDPNVTADQIRQVSELPDELTLVGPWDQTDALAAL